MTKININFNGEGAVASGNPITSSGTNLNLQNGSPRIGGVQNEESNKMYGSKLYASNSSTISGIQTKKTLQGTNSTSNLESHHGGSGGASGPAIITKGAYYPTMRSKQVRDG